MLSATAATGLLIILRFFIIILRLLDTILPFHLLGLNGLIGVIAIFPEFKDKIGPCTERLYAVLPAGVETSNPSPINLFIHKIIKNEKIKLKTPNALRSWITLSSFLKVSEDIILNRIYSKIKNEKLTVNTFLKKLYFLYNKKINLKNSFNREIIETFKILKKSNY